MKMLSCAAAMLALVSLAPLGAAQRGFDHYLLAQGNTMLKVNPSTGVATTLATLSSGSYDNVTMGTGNQYAHALVVNGSTSYIVRLHPNGGQTTLSSIPTSGRANGITMDQDGRSIVSLSDGRILSVWLGSKTTIAQSAGISPNAVCMDDDTGDYVVGRYLNSSSGNLIRVDRASGTMTTFAGTPGVTGCDHDQWTGRFVITTRAAPQLRVLNRNGTVHTTKAFTHDLEGVQVDDITGHVHVYGGGFLYELDEALGTVRTHGSFGFNSGMTLYGARLITGNGTGKPGSVYTVDGGFTNHPNQFYAASLGMSGLRPGFTSGSGARINIALDPLVFATIGGRLPLFTQRFGAYTDASGTFNARFTIPDIGKPYRLTFSTSVLDTSVPGNIVPAPSLTINVR